MSYLNQPLELDDIKKRIKILEEKANLILNLIELQKIFNDNVDKSIKDLEEANLKPTLPNMNSKKPKNTKATS